MTAEEILANAADTVERGWCQFTRNNRQQQHCILGALDLAVAGHTGCEDLLGFYQRGDLARTILHAVARELDLDDTNDFRTEGNIATWNNTEGRIAEEVATTLRNAKRWL